MNNENKDMEKVEPMWDVLEHLSVAPDSQLDKSMCDKLKELLLLKDKPDSNKEVADGLLYVMDMCVYGSLSSGFVIQILDMEWKRLGGTVEEGNANCPWRNNF